MQAFHTLKCVVMYLLGGVVCCSNFPDLPLECSTTLLPPLLLPPHTYSFWMRSMWTTQQQKNSGRIPSTTRDIMTVFSLHTKRLVLSQLGRCKCVGIAQHTKIMILFVISLVYTYTLCCWYNMRKHDEKNFNVRWKPPEILPLL